MLNPYPNSSLKIPFGYSILHNLKLPHPYILSTAVLSSDDDEDLQGLEGLEDDEILDDGTGGEAGAAEGETALPAKAADSDSDEGLDDDQKPGQSA